MSELPIWEEREQPTTRLIDVRTPLRDYATLPETDFEQNSDYLAWINEYKEALHGTFHKVQPLTVERLEARDINLKEVIAAVSDVVERPAYPSHRVISHYDMRHDRMYKMAAEDGFFPSNMKLSNGGPAYGQFEYILHFVRLRASYINKAPRSSVVDTLAFALGHASVNNLTYTHLERAESGNTVYHWYGASWRWDDQYYGEVLDDASAAKVAAESRQLLGVTTPGPASLHPLVEHYREASGFSTAAVGAMALDLINRAAGHSDSLGVYRSLWSYMTNGQNDASRQELAATVIRATQGAMTLEELELETKQSDQRGMSLTMLQRVEEACGITGSEQPSRHLSRTDFY